MPDPSASSIAPHRLARFLPAAAVVAVAAVLVAFAAWPAVDFFRPAQEVRVAAVLPALQAEATADPAAPARRSVQAAGWLEPSPWPVVVSALADGVVEAVEVIEGGSVEEGQVIARLVHDDADLAARRAAAASAGRGRNSPRRRPGCGRRQRGGRRRRR